MAINLFSHQQDKVGCNQLKGVNKNVKPFNRRYIGKKKPSRITCEMDLKSSIKQ